MSRTYHKKNRFRKIFLHTGSYRLRCLTNISDDEPGKNYEVDKIRFNKVVVVV